ncbi:Uncharacterised protein [Vibrio cholerae]|nr:Uncharacterised protein [Vibrio cholerae]CSI82385.1 Uncharacterised protein [Vibrio cholerae]
MSGTTVSVDVLTQQVNFTHPLLGKLSDLEQDIVHRTADFFTACVRHYAVSTVF